MSKAACRRWAWVCFTLAALFAILLFRIVLTYNFGFITSSWAGDGTAEDGVSAAFRIEGNATVPISPGVSAPLDLRFTNPHQVPMRVTALKVTLRTLTTPEANAKHPCTMDDYRLIQIKESVKITLPSNDMVGFQDLNIPRAAWPRVAMRNRDVNQDGCRGAKLRLDYTAFGILGN
jgi:hypothetical protein